MFERNEKKRKWIFRRFLVVGSSSAALLGMSGSASISQGTQDMQKKCTQTQTASSKNDRKTSGAKKNGYFKFKMKKKALKNGLQVIVVEDGIAPRISVGVLYKVGSCDDPENVFGISHMLEHMFFHGSKKYPDYARTISLLGGETNAMTSEDFTMYVVDCPASAIEIVMDVEADRMEHFNLTNDKVFLREQNAVFEERLMHIENRPLGTTLEFIRACLSPYHPYGKDIGGRRSHILSYSREAIMQHYRTWYKPNNATVVVVGAVNAEEVFKLVEAKFGSIKPGKVPPRDRLKNQLTDGFHQAIEFCSDEVESVKVRLNYTAPHHRDNLRKCYALNLVITALFGGVMFSFCRYFIDKLGMVADFGCNFDWDLDPRPLSVSVSLMPEKKAADFLKKFNVKLKAVVSSGISMVEFGRAKKMELAKYKANDSHRGIRMWLAGCLANLSSFDEIDQEKVIATIESISLDEANIVLREVFGAREQSSVILYPKGAHGGKSAVS
ncbi:MAG: insulinase family protein [Holosporales bacterium]|jgi:zinc protease|nr:insulinase family protein [Holosporales bacterium]